MKLLLYLCVKLVFLNINMDDLQLFTFEVIKELEKKFKNACCNKSAEAYLDSALLIKQKLNEFKKNKKNASSSNQ